MGRNKADWMEASRREVWGGGFSRLSPAGKGATQGSSRDCVLVLVSELKGQDEEAIESKQP